MSNRLGLSHWNPYAVQRRLPMYYCNMMEWFWLDSSLIFDDQLVSFSALTPLVWSSHLACKNRPRNDLLCVEWDVKPYTLTHSLAMDQVRVEPAPCRLRVQYSADRPLHPLDHCTLHNLQSTLNINTTTTNNFRFICRSCLPDLITQKAVAAWANIFSRGCKQAERASS